MLFAIDMGKFHPSLIYIVGADGSGKSSLAQWLVSLLRNKHIKTTLVRSRFNNWFSKPLLALTRLTGHNYYQKIDDVLFGFHDFEKLYCTRYLFALLQVIDVNIATFCKIVKARNQFEVVVCERGPWDSLVDVIADTGLDALADNFLGKLFTSQVRADDLVFLVDRTKENIISTRHELIHDYKLDKKIFTYKRLACANGWFILNNNGCMSKTKEQIMKKLNLCF